MKKTVLIARRFFKIALCIFIFTLVNEASAQTAHTLLRKADRDYLNNDYKSAEENYTKAQKAERTSKGDYNLANSIYQQQRYDEAAKQYGDIAANILSISAGALFSGKSTMSENIKAPEIELTTEIEEVVEETTDAPKK